MATRSLLVLVKCALAVKRNMSASAHAVAVPPAREGLAAQSAKAPEHEQRDQ